MSEAEVMARAFLPEILMAPDVAVALRVEEVEALRMLEAGEVGKTFKVGQKLAVLRSTFIQALKRRGAGR